MLGPQIDDENNVVTANVTLDEALLHFITITWKVVFDLIPPRDWGGGWPAFYVALGMIGVVTAVVGEVALLFGCVIGLRTPVTGITFVALGTSLPDTFASMTAARTSENADSAVGNVTGSNSVNVFLGMGLPYLFATYWNAYGMEEEQEFVAKSGDMALAVVIFLIMSLVCFLLVGIRRRLVGGELGGPPASRYLSALFLCTLWVIFAIILSLKVYELI